MKTMTKAQFIAMIESEIEDDAQIVGYSSMGGEAFELDQGGDVFLHVDDEMRESYDLPDYVTHIFEVV